MNSVRLDKWLWAARFFKTRSQAKNAIDGGHVRLNGKRAKAAKEVKCGDMLDIRRGSEDFAVHVEALAERHGGGCGLVSGNRRFHSKARAGSGAAPGGGIATVLRSAVEAGSKAHGATKARALSPVRPGQWSTRRSTNQPALGDGARDAC